MVYLPLEGLLPRAGNSSYKLVRMVAMRALEIGEGGAKLIESSANEKPVTTAMREVIAGKVMLKAVADRAVRAKKAVKGAKSE
jgi:DNA-directed RNA polymerase omega subunit